MEYKLNRAFLKFDFPFDYDSPLCNPLADTDQTKGVPMPPGEKPFNDDDLIALPDPRDVVLKKRDIFDIIDSRESRRTPNSNEMTLNELSFILWAVQGVRINNNPNKKRTVPSAGSRYPFDTYFFALSVENLPIGLYRYVWSKHAIVPVSVSDENKNEMARQIEKFTFFKISALTIFWVVVPYRCEWRYAQFAHKACALDAGHVGQNGYLAAEALGRGCCAIGGYSQDIDQVIGVDGVDEFTCYIEAFM